MHIDVIFVIFDDIFPFFFYFETQ